jgi:putative ubiquitin-RnfH superfamily antitoxin RatB of RatAB toxin-antitoxin module
MDKDAASAWLSVCVVYSPTARTVLEYPLRLAVGSTVADAVRISGLLDHTQEVPINSESVGVWGRMARASQVLREGDRIEIYRPLKVDPKVARRERYQKQGAGAAGLFAKRRSNAKAGY